MLPDQQPVNESGSKALSGVLIMLIFCSIISNIKYKTRRLLFDVYPTSAGGGAHLGKGRAAGDGACNRENGVEFWFTLDTRPPEPPVS